MRRLLTGLSGSLLLVLAVGCGRPPADRGQVVADGVARAGLEVRANGTDLVPVTVLFPADGDGRPTARGLPVLVYVQGGAVTPSRYEGRLSRLVARGYVVALPRHPLDLAFFGIDHGAATRRALLAPEPGSFLEGLVDPQRVGVGGHSLGGVVAMKLALGGGFQAVVVEASFSDPADDSKLKSFTVPSLFLAAKQDCQAKEAQVREGWDKMPSPTALVVLEGVTHFQFSDSDAEDFKRSCPPDTSLETAHARITAALDTFLSASLSTGAVGAGLSTLAGAEVVVR
ncbi:MAG: hypothetical protein JNJ54_10025 [Myxococcaceae bacterium]|nr:hypothetical protein [Myxococcaceae bacterium]